MSRGVVSVADVKTLFLHVTEKLSDSFELPIRDTTLSYKQFCDSAEILLDQVMLETPLTPGKPIKALLPPNTLFPTVTLNQKPSAGRCSANALSGLRCRGESYLPFTLRTIHWRYFQKHGILPPGGKDAEHFASIRRAG